MKAFAGFVNKHHDFILVFALVYVVVSRSLAKIQELTSPIDYEFFISLSVAWVLTYTGRTLTRYIKSKRIKPVTQTIKSNPPSKPE